MIHVDYRKDIKKITVPTAYFLPDYPLYPRATAEFIRDNASAEVKIVDFEKCTHMIALEYPEKTAKEIDNFIKEI